MLIKLNYKLISWAGVKSLQSSLNSKGFRSVSLQFLVNDDQNVLALLKEGR